MEREGALARLSCQYRQFVTVTVLGGEGGLTVKPVLTVAVKDPRRNLPRSYWTTREVLPAPLSPTRTVCRERERWGGG